MHGFRWSLACIAFLSLMIVGCGSSSQTDARADVVDELVRDGSATRDQAECVVDGMERAGFDISVEDLDLSAKQVEQMMGITIECQGGASISDCFIEAMVDVLGPERLQNSDAFVRASKDMTVEERQELMTAGFECQGAPPEAAQCVVDAMVDRFGRSIFESEKLELSAAQQKQLESMQQACTVLTG